MPHLLPLLVVEFDDGRRLQPEQHGLGRVGVFAQIDVEEAVPGLRRQQVLEAGAVGCAALGGGAVVEQVGRAVQPGLGLDKIPGHARKNSVGGLAVPQEDIDRAGGLIAVGDPLLGDVGFAQKIAGLSAQRVVSDSADHRDRKAELAQIPGEVERRAAQAGAVGKAVVEDLAEDETAETGFVHSR